MDKFIVNDEILGYKVYIKVDKNNIITAINSSEFLSDTKDWIKIDEGEGDKYLHAQNAYLDKPLIDEYGRYNYKYVNGNVIEISDNNKPSISLPVPTQQERLEALEAALLEVVLGG